MSPQALTARLPKMRCWPLLDRTPASATVAAVAGMGLAGQIAQGRMSGYDGNGSFRTYLLDALYNLDGDALEAGARVEELA